MNKDLLLVEAKRRYPIGTRFKCVHGNSDTKCSGFKDGLWTVLQYRYIGDPHFGVHSENGWIHLRGKWAEIISSPEQKITYNYLIL